ncbi:MAG: homoserine kinase [Pyrinomonadaceae bacterium]
MDIVRVTAPASVSNVVCGFDVLGFALAEPFDELTARNIAGARGEVRIVHRDDFGLPTDAERNVAGVAARAVLDAAGANFGVELEITKRIKPGSGIGSSAASACGAAAAVNRLLGDHFSPTELIELAMAGEQLASGSRHADNVAPCLLGGFTLVRSVEPEIDVVRLAHPELYAAVIHPQIEIRTSEARAMLPADVSLKSAIRQWANLGAFVAALSSGDHDLMARSMRDEIVEPVRSALIPRFDELRSASLAAGAFGGGISGSGPSVFMLSRTLGTARAVAAAMSGVYADSGITFHTYVSPIASNGVTFREDRRY